MKILALAADPQSLITAIRVAEPLSQLARQRGWTLRVLAYHACMPADLDAADVLVAQRPTDRRHLALLQHMHAGPGAIVCEIDDLLTEMAPHLLHHGVMQDRAVWVQRALALADAVSVSTAALGEALSDAQAGPAAVRVVVPNHGQPCDGPLPVAVPGQPACVLLAASDRLWPGGLLQALLDVQRESPGGLRVVAVGPAADGLAAAGLQVEAHPLLARADFIALARSLPNAVAAIPLDDSRFSACKSAIKWYDYAEAGVATLASAVSPYREAIDDDRTGALVDGSVQDWTAALRRARDDAGWRWRIAMAARAQVRARHTPALTLQAWQTVIEAAVQRRAERPLQPPQTATGGGRAVAWLRAAWTALQVGLRGLNRARLARRQQRRRR